MTGLHWAFESPAAREAGALEPLRFEAAYGRRHQAREADLARAEALGRIVDPSDCGPMRALARYGFVGRCPGEVVLRRTPERLHEREHRMGRAAYGWASIEGSPWPNSDSGLVASWISGSEYVKVQTGIVVFFPKDCVLYQGPLPNAGLLEGEDLGVVAGIEYGTVRRQALVCAEQMNVCSLNAIVKLPPIGTTTRIEAGAPLVWFFPASPSRRLTLQRVSGENVELLP